MNLGEPFAILSEPVPDLTAENSKLRKQLHRTQNALAGAQRTIARIAHEGYAGIVEAREAEVREYRRILQAVHALNRELVEACRGVDVVYAELGAALPGIVNSVGFELVSEAVRTARAVIEKATSADRPVPPDAGQA